MKTIFNIIFLPIRLALLLAAFIIGLLLLPFQLAIPMVDFTKWFQFVNWFEKLFYVCSEGNI